MMYLPLFLALGAVLLIGLYAVRKVDKFIEENRRETENETAETPVLSDDSIKDAARATGRTDQRSGICGDMNSSRTTLKKSIGCNSRTQIL